MDILKQDMTYTFCIVLFPVFFNYNEGYNISDEIYIP